MRVGDGGQGQAGHLPACHRTRVPSANFSPPPHQLAPRDSGASPGGCQEACCHANGPGWVGAMVMSDSQLLLGLWAREGRGREEASPAGRQLPAHTTQCARAVSAWTGDNTPSPRLGAMGGRGPGTASRAPTCTVPVFGVTLGQVLAKRSGCSEGVDSGVRRQGTPPTLAPPPPTHTLCTRKGGLRGHPQQALPSHFRPPRAGRSQFRGPWRPAHLGRTCRRGQGLLSLQPRPPSACGGREVGHLAHRNLREGS